MKIGIIVAMEKEFVQLRTLLDEATVERRNGKDFVSGILGSNEIIMQQSGIGKVNAAIGTVEMINNYHPDLIISTGVAGGTDADMNIMDVVVATECVYHDAYCGKEQQFGQVMGMPPRFKTAKEIVEIATKELQDKEQTKNIHPGLIVTGDWFVDDKEKMRTILERFPEAKAVDMESSAIAQTCYIYHTPFISFRIISDIPLKDTDASQYYDFWSRLAEGSFNVTKELLLKIEKKQDIQ